MDAKLKQHQSEDQSCLNASVGMQSQEHHLYRQLFLLALQGKLETYTVTEYCDSAVAPMPMEKQTGS